MKIILLGYMASGKSSIGKIVAEKYTLPFIDLDDYIEKQEGKSVSAIFKDKGEIYFRRKENECLQELLHHENNFVLSLGGGTPCYANNMQLINESVTCLSIYLQAKVATIVNRLKNEKEQRPLVANLNENDLDEFVAKHLFERSFFYNQATYKVNIDTKDIETICSEIYSLLT
ncbi:shikimate kinase [Tenacibaculum sp. TC6]|uniref:shikimate kinase n=1 Tax=Tenacibaculum sp. TC6 TaxID=3423223 RepID=UPI003D35EC91